MDTPTPVSPTPLPTATPDILGSPPASRAEARKGVEAALRDEPADDCPERLRSWWEVACQRADFDGDGKPDDAFLVPLAKGGSLPNAAVVLVRLARRELLEEFPGPAGAADASIVGRAVFGALDRNGAGGPELTLLANECGAHTCSSRVLVMSWDGTAWRDIGPNPGVDNLDAPVAFDGEGTATTITMHGGQINSAGAGPTRGSTYRYELKNGRFELSERKPDPPRYLFHAIQDADALFDRGDFAEAIAAYQAALADKQLRDWREEAGEGRGRPTMEAYSLFRIAIATAALGRDATVEMDRTIEQSKEPLFARGIEAFRNGYQERKSVQAGCIAATTYFSTVTAESNVPEYIRALFSYGYANLPVKGPRDLCPL